MGRVNLGQISYMVLDEADRMLDMGFKPQIRKIVKEIPARRQTLMYTATWTKEVRKIDADLLARPVQVNIGNVDELVANKAITQKERNQEMAMELPPKYVSTPIHQKEENIHKLPPNKLSENIMKCLINIFVRLIRTSRVMELEKSGPICLPPLARIIYLFNSSYFKFYTLRKSTFSSGHNQTFDVILFQIIYLTRLTNNTINDGLESPKLHLC